MKRKKVVISLLLATIFIVIAVLIANFYFPVNFLFADFPDKNSFDLTVECDADRVYHVNDSITIKATLNNRNHHTYAASHTGKAIYFDFRLEGDETEIAYPALYVGETIWSSQDIVAQQTFQPEQPGTYYLTAAANFTISHKDQGENYQYEEKIKIIVE